MAKLKSFRDLTAWQRAMDLVEEIYRETIDWPESERYGLREQARRAAVSIPSNIAEGQGRGTDRELYRFLCIAKGSLCELQTLLVLAERLQFQTSGLSRRTDLADEVGRILGGLMKTVQPART